MTALAKQARLTTSELVRRLVLGQSLPDTHRHEAVINLVKVNADMARLGNLLRMVLMDDDEELRPDTIGLENLYEEIRDTQILLKTKIKDL